MTAINHQQGITMPATLRPSLTTAYVALPFVELAALAPFTQCETRNHLFERIHFHITRDNLLIIASNGKHLAVIDSCGHLEGQSELPAGQVIELDLPALLIGQAQKHLAGQSYEQARLIFDHTMATAALIHRDRRFNASLQQVLQTPYPDWRKVWHHHDHPHQSVSLNPHSLEAFTQSLRQLTRTEALKCRLVCFTEEPREFADALFIQPARATGEYADRFCGLSMSSKPLDAATALPAFLQHALLA